MTRNADQANDPRACPPGIRNAQRWAQMLEEDAEGTAELEESKARLREHDPDLAERVAGAVPPQRSSALGARRQLAKGAREHARWCGRCARDLDPDELIFRQHEAGSVGSFGIRQLGPLAAVCRDCRDWWRMWTFPQPCETCDRPVSETRDRQTITCCDRCAREAENARRRAARAEANAKVCAGCEEPFEATRSDARYCSPACRQSAHRARKRH